MKYEPAPIDTSNVALPPELAALAEDLARNTHEVWASERLAQGWRYGAERNDARKENPCLIPYDALSEAEKEIDRCTAAEVLKAVFTLGYRVELPSDENPAPTTETAAAEKAAAVLRTLETPAGRHLPSLLALWRVRDPEIWTRRTRLYRDLGERIFRLGEPLPAAPGRRLPAKK